MTSKSTGKEPCALRVCLPLKSVMDSFFEGISKRACALFPETIMGSAKPAIQKLRCSALVWMKISDV